MSDGKKDFHLIVVGKDGTVLAGSDEYELTYAEGGMALFVPSLTVSKDVFHAFLNSAKRGADWSLDMCEVFSGRNRKSLGFLYIASADACLWEGEPETRYTLDCVVAVTLPQVVASVDSARVQKILDEAEELNGRLEQMGVDLLALQT